ncbi:MAG: Uma2 family endonuclease [Isosphaeraceae bacterium]
MSTSVVTRYTPEDLLAMPDGKSYELVDGELVERNIGAESSWIGGMLYAILLHYCHTGRLGIVWPADNGYECFPHAPGLVRKPDVSFIRSGRLAGNRLPKGWIKIPPDLAVEVVSPNDTAGGLEEKLEDYRRVHVPLIWVIYPALRMVRVFRHNGPTTDLREDDELSGEDVIPGFRCRLREVLPPPQPAETGPPVPPGPNGV